MNVRYPRRFAEIFCRSWRESHARMIYLPYVPWTHSSNIFVGHVLPPRQGKKKEDKKPTTRWYAHISDVGLSPPFGPAPSTDT